MLLQLVLSCIGMLRPQSENTFQIALKVSPSSIKDADRLAKALSTEGISITRTDIIRSALIKGLRALQKETAR